MQNEKPECPAPQAYLYTLRMPGIRSDEVICLQPEECLRT
jgi:hypothetical protein